LVTQHPTVKKNNEVKSKNDHPIEFNEINTHDTTSDTLIEESPPSTTTDATVNSLQCSALPIYASLDVKSSEGLNSLIPLWTF